MDKKLLRELAGDYIPPTYKEKLRAKVDKVPKKIKQQFIDHMKSGMKLGEARELLGLEIMVAATIFQDQIGTHHYLKDKIE